MRRLACTIVLLVVVTCTETAQGQVQAWDVTLNRGDIRTSIVTARNVCQRSHRFDIELRNLRFGRLRVPSTITIGPRAAAEISVLFDASTLEPGEYAGMLIIRCITCVREPGCSQDQQFNVRAIIRSVPPIVAPPDAGDSCLCLNLTVNAVGSFKRGEQEVKLSATEDEDVQNHKRKISISIPYKVTMRCGGARTGACKGKVVTVIDKRDWCRHDPYEDALTPAESPVTWACDEIPTPADPNKPRDQQLQTTPRPDLEQYDVAKYEVKYPDNQALFKQEVRIRLRALECAETKSWWMTLVIDRTKEGLIDKNASDYDGDDTANGEDKRPWGQ